MFNPEYLKKLFSIDSKFTELLQSAPSKHDARNALSDYWGGKQRQLYRNYRERRSMEWFLQVSCIVVLRRMISLRSEMLAHFDLMELLWNLAHENFSNLPSQLSDAFFEDLMHVVKGACGISGVYKDEKVPRFFGLKGREAAIDRSRELDEIARWSDDFLSGYISGLDEEIIKTRETNRRRIQNVLEGTEEDWFNYQWQLKHVIREVDTLGRLIQLSETETEAIRLANQYHLPFGITPYYVSLMDEESHRRFDHAIRAQVIPPLDYVQAMIQHKGDLNYSFDFMLEHDTSPVDLITRRYPRVVILKPYNTCSQICVYCQRNWEIDQVLDPHALASMERIETAIDWIREHHWVAEVLITGGDPLIMHDDMIDKLMKMVADIDHVERIRIGSRVPVVIPQRITPQLIDILASYQVPGRREVVLVTHFEHVSEITPDSMQAIQQFKRNGISAYNQAVYTIENSRRFELVALRRLLRLIGVDPYYSFNAKGKQETAQYRVPMARLQQEIKEEARLFPGIMRTDEAVYNVPRLGKNYLRAEQNHTLLTILADGRRVYEYHPWEKNLVMADTYIDTDVPIYDYLKALERRGENPENYKTIYYYF